MKNTILMTIVLVLGLATLSNAQEPLSFRSNALGGIIDDDLDLIYDPIELQFVDSLRLYTNLSNLTSGNEKLFDNISDDEFLIGISSKNPFMKSIWHSALVRFQNSETSNSVGIDSDLDGYMDVTGNGTLIDEYTAYLDTDYDGLYDQKNILTQEKSDFITNESYSLILNNSFNLGKMILGVKLSSSKMTTTGSTAFMPLGSGHGILSSVYPEDPTYARSVTTYLIEDEYNNQFWSDNGVFNSKNMESNTGIRSSAMFPLSTIELRGDLVYYLSKGQSDIGDSYSGEYEYFDPEITEYENNYSETHLLNLEEKEDGAGIILGGSIRNTFSKQEERKNDGYWEIGFSFNLGSYDYTNSISLEFVSNETSLDGELSYDDFIRTISDEYSTTDNGTGKLNIIKINSRFNIPLGEKVQFGIGGFLNRSTNNRETKFREFVNDITNYNYTDSEYNDDDYVTTETSQLTADRTYDIYSTTFTCPVGMEYHLGDKNNWSLRFGTIFISTSQTVNDAKQITDSEPDVTETEYGDGDVTIDIENNIYESISEHTRTASSSTVFTYGLGYNPTKNLQIDMLGIGSGDLEFDGVRLSFSVKF